MRRLMFLVATPLAILVLMSFPAAHEGGSNGHDHGPGHRFSIDEASIPELQHALATHVINSKQLVRKYLKRIAAYGPLLNPYITINPHALEQAHERDVERAHHDVRGPLHGIPIALKDIVLTTGIASSGGALAFKGYLPPYQATLANKLLAAGAVIIGKTVQTELANWVSDDMPGNYSATGGYGYNPWDPRQDPRTELDSRGYPFNDGRPAMNTGGSSSGIAESANLAAGSVGTETSGSILSPSNQTMLVGIKPTVGLISRYGVMPITADQDTAGPMTRDVTSAAIMLQVMAGPDPLDTPAFMGPPACPAENYLASLDPNGLQQARIGIPQEYYDTSNDDTKAALEAAKADLEAAGATVAFVSVPSFADLNAFPPCSQREQTHGNDTDCSIVLKYGDKRDFNAFLASLGPSAPVHTLTELREFNLAHDNPTDNAIKYGQARLDISDDADLTRDHDRYVADRMKDLDLAGTNGIDAALAAGPYDALLFAGARGADIAARPGYPSVTVPYTFIPNTKNPPFPADFDPKPQPLGMTFTANACSEPTLIRLAYAFEQATHRRIPPPSAPPLKSDTAGGKK